MTRHTGYRYTVWKWEMTILLPLFLAAVQATVVREGLEYALQAHDGRWLVCSADADRPRLLPEASVPANRTFSFVRVSGKRNTAYLRFGDVLLTAVGGKDRSDPLLGAQFQLLTRPADGKVALSSAAYSTLLRPGSMNADGSVELEQGGEESDEAVWWRLCTVAPDGSVSDAESNQQCAAKLKPVQAASNGWSPFGWTKGSKKEPRATATSTVSDSKRKSKMSSSAFRAQPMAVRAARARSRSKVFAAAGALLVGTTAAAAMVPTTTLVQIAGGASAALRVGALSPLLRHSVFGSTLASTGQVVGSAFRWLVAHPAGVLQRAVVAAASRVGTAASGAAVALGRARSEHELGSVLAVLSCLVFNTYLAVLSHSLPAADRPPDDEQQEQESVAVAGHEQGSDSATQLLLRDW